jgi:uncharacterized membrane protein
MSDTSLIFLLQNTKLTSLLLYFVSCFLPCRISVRQYIRFLLSFIFVSSDEHTGQKKRKKEEGKKFLFLLLMALSAFNLKD